MKKGYKVSKEIKDQILKRVKEEGISVIQAAEDHGVSTKTIYNWLTKGVTKQVSWGERNLEDKNSAKELTSLIRLIADDVRIVDKGEEIGYYPPTTDELQMLANIAKNEYLSFSEEYLPKETRQTGTKLVAPLKILLMIMIIV